MNKSINFLNPLKPILIVLFSFLLFTSCNKANVEKPEKVCTLTAEQVPDVRGFRLGTSYNALKQQFPNLCNYNSLLIITTYKGSAKNNTGIDSDCGSVNIENHPNLEGVSKVVLGFEKEAVSRILISYDKTTDKDFENTFKYKMGESLGINIFTNSSYISNLLTPDAKNYTMEGTEILCNKVNIQMGVAKVVNVSPAYYTPFLVIERSEKVAITKAQEEEDQKTAEDQKRAEDQKKRETFKP